MRQRLNLLFEGDGRARWRMIAFSALSVSLCGFIGQLQGIELRGLQLISAGVGAIVFSAQLLLYAIRPTRTVPSVTGGLRRLLFSVLLLAVSALLALAAVKTGPWIQRIVVNRRLASALKHPTEPSPQTGVRGTQTESVSSIVSYALNSGIALSNDLTISSVGQVLTEAERELVAGHPNEASVILRIVPELISPVTGTVVRAPPEDFHGWIETLDRAQSRSSAPELIDEARRVRIALAEYRSKIETAVPSPNAVYILLPPEILALPKSSLQLTAGAVIDLRNLPPGVSALSPGTAPFFSGIKSDSSSREVFLMNGTQSLDNQSWAYVVFSNMVVQYSGGSLDISNAKFVNCRFDLTPASSSDRFADYIALGLPKFSN